MNAILTSIPEWLECLGRDRLLALEKLMSIAKGAAASRVWGRTQQEELESDLIDVLMTDDFATIRKAPPTVHLGAWICGVAANIVRRRTSNRARSGFRASNSEARRMHVDSEVEASLEEVDLNEDVRRYILATASQLPSPYREIIIWQRINGMTRRQIAARLARWRATGLNRSRIYITRAHTMFKSVSEGREVQKLWARRFSGKNVWKGVPPPFPTDLCDGWARHEAERPRERIGA